MTAAATGHYRHRKLVWAMAHRDDPEEAEKRMAAHCDGAIGALLK